MAVARVAYYTHRMKYLLGVILVLAVLLGAGIFLYRYLPARTPEGTAATSTSASAVEMRVATMFDSTDTYTVSARYPQFGIPAVDQAVKGAIDAALAEFKTMAPIPADSAAGKNEFDVSFDRVYVGPDVVSVELFISEYTGGAHPNTVAHAINVDPRTGAALSENDALAMIGKSLPDVATDSLAQLKAAHGDDISFPEGADPKPENYETFLISKSAVTFVFQNYQVAPYAAGLLDVSFPRIK
jgi:hypothetical protein